MCKNQSMYHELNVDHRQVPSDNVNQHTKFQQLPSSITFRVPVGGPKIKSGAVDLPRCPLADKFLYGALASSNTYQRTKFQLPS